MRAGRAGGTGLPLRGGAAPYDVTVETIGRERAGLYWRRTEEALDRLESLAGDAFRRTGSLRLAADDEERDALAVEYEALRADGFAAEWVDEPLERPVPRGDLPPVDAALQPARWVRGSPSSPPRPASRSASTAGSSRSTTLEAGQVLVATDGYPSGLLGQLEGLIVPTRAR